MKLVLNPNELRWIIGALSVAIRRLSEPDDSSPFPQTQHDELAQHLRALRTRLANGEGIENG